MVSQLLCNVDVQGFQHSIAHKFGLYPGVGSQQGVNHMNVSDHREPIAKAYGCNTMAEMALNLPPIDKKQVPGTIKCFEFIRLEQQKVYAMVFRFATPISGSFQTKRSILYDLACMTESDRGKYLIRIYAIPAKNDMPVILVFCRKIATRLYENGFHMLQTPVGLSFAEYKMQNLILPL